jgi:hypothetical protein
VYRRRHGHRDRPRARLIQAFEQAPGGPGGPTRAADPGARPDDTTGARGPLVCHEHTFVNPGGFVHRIGCFAVATGCSYLGAPETAFSWFPGCSWQIAACGRCRAHLGWIFRAPGEQFHGLLVDAIRPG